MSSISLKLVEDRVTKRLESFYARIDGLQGFLNSTLYEIYQRAQINRWETEGASESKRKWKPLNTLYQKRKALKFASYPYAGRRMGVATGDLIQSVVGGSDRRFHRKVVTGNQLIVGTTLQYARHFAEERPIFEFGKDTRKEMRTALVKYLRGAL